MNIPCNVYEINMFVIIKFKKKTSAVYAVHVLLWKRLQWCAGVLVSLIFLDIFATSLQVVNPLIFVSK